MTADKKGPSPSRLTELLLIAVFAGLVFWQLFLPPIVGSVDNGDFSKVSRRFCIGVTDYQTSWYTYFQPSFEYSLSNCWDSGIPTSEMVPASIAVPVGLWGGGGKRFDIRYLGMVHALLLISAYYFFTRALRPLSPGVRITLGLVAIWIFADSNYVAYLNSFYTDTAAMLGILLAVPLGILVAREPERLFWLALCGAAALFFVFSKTQHAIWSPLLAAHFVMFSRCVRRGILRWSSIAIGLALISAAGWLFLASPKDVSVLPRFNLIFGRLAQDARNPSAALIELGLGRQDLPYVGMHAFSDGNPTPDAAWRKRFERASYARVAGYYLRHPSVALRIMADVLQGDAAGIREFASYRREDGFAPHTVAKRFGYWNNLREKLFRSWPWHVIAWLAAVAVGSAVLLVRGRDAFTRRMAWISLSVVTLAVGEYAIASLTDIQETFRHLFLFHVLTDITTLFAVTWLLTWVVGKGQTGAVTN